MGLISAIVTLPLAPVRGLVAIAEIVREEIEQELRSPAAIQHDLEAAEKAREAEHISVEQEADIEQQVLNRLIE